ncbi:fatty-acyl-CoA synthase [Xylariomycetidae sp. FL0641]|nr:fatty-acyl-CoA synthase [Xylariomycetidae sp. FL0641]
MTSTIAGAAAGAAALGAYLNAKYHIGSDLAKGSATAQRARAARVLAERAATGQLLVYDALAAHASSRAGGNVFLVFEGRQWTYAQFHAALAPVGNWLLGELGVARGEVVVLDGPNSPEYLLLWLALEALGAVPAFVNCQLGAGALAHCVRLAGARVVLADAEVAGLVAGAALGDGGVRVRVVHYSRESLEALRDDTPLPVERRRGHDPLGVASLMYTSGTTGMPKAVVQTRVKELGFVMAGEMIGIRPGERMYTCLPLYHLVAHGTCVVPSIGCASTVVLSRKFSHKTFWPEVHASGATIIQYVGELCRYLVNAPPSPLDRGHKVHTAWGNGMRPDIWERFRERFGIACIHELYGASDGMAFTSNINRGEFTRGAIGLRGPLWYLLNTHEKRVLIDPDTQELRRGSNGFAIAAGVNEPGETITRMDASAPDRGTPDYFKNHDAVVRRRITDVFQKGDIWYRSGDLMREDADGRLYFVDRLGDTFRWHSENVSTNEVSDVVGLFPQIAEANVYGVLVPNADGRAGCAAIVPANSTGEGEEPVDWKALAAHLRANLPRYAVPIFLRLAKELEYTGTMKLQKGRLRNEGIDLKAIEQAATDKGESMDVMYWLPPNGDAYTRFTEQDFQQLKAGKVKI